MEKIRLMVTVLIMLRFTGLCFAADVLQVNLEKCIEIGLEHNLDLKIDRLSTDKYDLEYKYIRHQRFRPVVNLTVQPPDYEKSVSTIYDDEGRPKFLDRTMSSSYTNFSVDQPLPYQGNLLFSITQNLDQVETLGEVTKTNYSSLNLEFKKPIFKVDTLKNREDKAFLDKLYQQQSYQQKIIDLKYDITKQYYTCIKAMKEIAITREKLQQSRYSLQIAKNKFAAGLVPETEVLKLEVELGKEKARLEKSSSYLQSHKDKLKDLLGINLMEIIKLDPNIKINTIKYDLDSLVKSALQKRSEIKLKELALQRLAVDYSELKKINRPYCEIYGYVALKSTGEELSDSFQKLKKTNQIGLNIVVPVWDSGKNKISKHKINIGMEKLRLEIERIKRNIALDVKKAYLDLRESENLRKINKINLELAIKNNSIAQKRFLKGNITSQELLDSQIALNSVKRDLMNAQIDYLVAQAYLEKITLFHYQI